MIDTKKTTNETMKILDSFKNSPITFLDELTSQYTLLEKDSKAFTSNYATCLILLLSMAENWNEVKVRKNKYSSLFKNKEEFKNLFKICEKFNKDPYSNIYNELFFFNGSNSIEVQTILKAYLENYEYKQARYLSSTYKTISIKNLSKYLEPLYDSNNNNFNEYMKKYEFSYNNDKKFVVLKPLEKKLNFNEFKDDLIFVNKMSVQLENIVKINPSLLILPKEGKEVVGK